MTTSTSSCTSDYFNFDQLVESEKALAKIDREQRKAFKKEFEMYLNYHEQIERSVCPVRRKIDVNS